MGYRPDCDVPLHRHGRGLQVGQARLHQDEGSEEGWDRSRRRVDLQGVDDDDGDQHVGAPDSSRVEHNVQVLGSINCICSIDRWSLRHTM